MPSLLPTLKCTSLWILRSLRFPSSLFVLWRDVINCGSAPPRLSPPLLGRRLQQWRRLLFAGSWMKPRLGLAHRWHALPAGLRGLPAAMTSFASGCKRWEASPRPAPPPSSLYFPQLAFIAVSHFPTGFPFQTHVVGFTFCLRATRRWQRSQQRATPRFLIRAGKPLKPQRR